MKAIPAALAAAMLFAAFGPIEAEARATEGRQSRQVAHTAQRGTHATGPAIRTARQATQRSQARHGSQAVRGPAYTRQQTTRMRMVRQASYSGRRGAMRGGAGVSGGGGGISCVPYARQVTGMAISGNGRDWWYNAAGLYARSHRPEPGSVMAFPGTGSMRMGHVAVVERVVSPREVEIEHANWGGPGIRRGSVMRGVSVVDVSANNDWSAVRVQVGHDDRTFGRVYPVYGFIHNRPDPTGGAMLAGASGGRRPVTLAAGGDSPSLSSLRTGGGGELAQAPDTTNRTSGGGWRSLVLPANISYR